MGVPNSIPFLPDQKWRKFENDCGLTVNRPAWAWLQRSHPAGKGSIGVLTTGAQDRYLGKIGPNLQV